MYTRWWGMVWYSSDTWKSYTGFRPLFLLAWSLCPNAPWCGTSRIWQSYSRRACSACQGLSIGERWEFLDLASSCQFQTDSKYKLMLLQQSMMFWFVGTCWNKPRDRTMNDLKACSQMTSGSAPWHQQLWRRKGMPWHHVQRASNNYICCKPEGWSVWYCLMLNWMLTKLLFRTNRQSQTCNLGHRNLSITSSDSVSSYQLIAHDSGTDGTGLS